VNNLLILLGKRVHELRASRKWSQEEFAHISGLHRTYIGQIERGEKNISFGNLSKIASVLGVTLSELLAGLEEGQKGSLPHRQNRRGARSSNDIFRLQKLVKQLRVQQAAMDKVTILLEQLVLNASSTRRRSDSRQGKRHSGRD
jgi:transcriptional regulator with XRE-family HTH domain